MEEDTEVLDWGNEDDESQAADSYRGQTQTKLLSGTLASSGDQEEAEDAVSLGGDEDEDVYPYATESAYREQTPQPHPRDTRSRTPSQLEVSTDSKDDVQREDSDNFPKPQQTADHSQLQPLQSIGKLTHALPPKPVVAPPPYFPPSLHPVASSMVYRERRSNGHSKPLSSSQDGYDVLPPDWEVRYPRNGGRDAYYYNSRTHESTWTRPGPANSGRSSPTKEKEKDHGQEGGRSPVREGTDDTVRSARKDVRRRSSPGGPMSYDDRHYRPGEGGVSEQQKERRDSHASPRLHARQLSPPSRPVGERRPPGSPSPAPRGLSRSLERPGRAGRREFSPPPVDPSAPRDTSRDEHNTDSSPAQERAWGRSRNLSPLGSNIARSYDDRSTTSRSRRHRVDIEPPVQSLSTSQDIRTSATNEWSASRNRSSPSLLREISPVRRAPPADLPQRPTTPRYSSRFDRLDSNTPPRDASRTSPDSYTSSDRVPQRRGREYDAEYGSNTKRRRVDDTDDFRYRQLGEDRPTPPLPDRPAPVSASPEPPRMQKRAPLPPQSDRFREASRNPRAPSVMPPPPTGNLRVPPYPQESDRSGRSAANGASVPSGPRGLTQLPVEQGRNDIDSAMPPPGSGRTRTRFDNPAPPPPASNAVLPQLNRARDYMDVDYPPSRGSTSRNDDGPYRQGVASRNDRVIESSMGAVPTGPRAMSRHPSGYPAQASPSVPSQNFASRPPPPNASSIGKAGPRPPAPRSSRERPEPLSASSTRGGTQGAPQGPRMYENGRAGPDTEGMIDRGHGDALQDHRGPDSRPPLNSQLSGTNNIPIANKRQFGLSEPSDPYIRVTNDGRRDIGPRPDEASVTSTTGSVIYQTDPRRSPLSSYNPASPPNHYRSLPERPDMTPRYGASDRREGLLRSVRPHVQQSNLQASQRGFRDEPPHQTPGESSRPTRFGPPRQDEGTEPRTWLTREESLAMERRRELERSAMGIDSKTPPVSATSSKSHGGPMHGWSEDDLSLRPPPTRTHGRPHLEHRRSNAPERSPISSSARLQPHDGRRLSSASYDVKDDNPVRDVYPEHSRSSSPSSARAHTERARYMESSGQNDRGRDREPRILERARWPEDDYASLLPAIREPSPLFRAAKTTGSVKRQPKSLSDLPPSSRDYPQSDSRFADPNVTVSQRPPVQRSTSLLERLTDGPSLNVTVPPSQSLRDRVEPPLKRTIEEVHGLPPRPPPSEGSFTVGESDVSGRGGRGGKRRPGKPKKGRR